MYSFPAEWIKGNGTPREIERNEELSDLDKKFIKHLYGPPRTSPPELNTGLINETAIIPRTGPSTYVMFNALVLFHKQFKALTKVLNTHLKQVESSPSKSQLPVS